MVGKAQPREHRRDRAVLRSSHSQSGTGSSTRRALELARKVAVADLRTRGSSGPYLHRSLSDRDASSEGRGLAVHGEPDEGGAEGGAQTGAADAQVHEPPPLAAPADESRDKVATGRFPRDHFRAEGGEKRQTRGNASRQALHALRQLHYQATNRLHAERAGTRSGSAVPGISSPGDWSAGQAHLGRRPEPGRVSGQALEVLAARRRGDSTRRQTCRERPPFRVSPPKFINPPARTITGLRPRTWEREMDPFENVRTADRALEEACRKMVEQRKKEAAAKVAARERLRAQFAREVRREATVRVQPARTAERPHAAVAVERDIHHREEVVPAAPSEAPNYSFATQAIEFARTAEPARSLSREDSVKVITPVDEKVAWSAGRPSGVPALVTADANSPHAAYSGVKKTISIQTDPVTSSPASAPAARPVQMLQLPSVAPKPSVAAAVQCESSPRSKRPLAGEPEYATQSQSQPQPQPQSKSYSQLRLQSKSKVQPQPQSRSQSLSPSSSSSSSSSSFSSSSSSTSSSSSSPPSDSSTRQPLSEIREELELFREQLAHGVRERHDQVRKRQQAAKYRALLGRLSGFGVRPTAAPRETAEGKVLRFDATVQVNEDSPPARTERQRQPFPDPEISSRLTTRDVVVYKCECATRHAESLDAQRTARKEGMSASTMHPTGRLDAPASWMQADGDAEALRQGRQSSPPQDQEGPPDSPFVESEGRSAARIPRTYVLPDNITEDVWKGRDRFVGFLLSEEGVDAEKVEVSGMRPWDVVESIADDLVDQMLAQCAPEIERIIDEFVERMIEVEVLPGPAPSRAVEGR